MHIDEIDPHAPQTSLGMTAFHLDAGYTPLFPFGFGLSYADFVYDGIGVSAAEIPVGGTITVSAELTNRGDVAADEVAQLYVRDHAWIGGRSDTGLRTEFRVVGSADVDPVQ